MSTFTVPVASVEEITRHPNADRLDIAKILGWQVIVSKDSLKSGDLVMYVPPDSIVPPNLAEAFGVAEYLSNGRVRSVRLRGEPSYGFAVPISEVTSIWDKRFAAAYPNLANEYYEGDDLAGAFGITKYEPPQRGPSGTFSASEHPLFPRYTNIENLRHYPNIFIPNEKVVVTEKIHGMNVRIGKIDGEYMAGSHNHRRKWPREWEREPFWFPLTVPGVKELLDDWSEENNQVILFGELYGANVQSLKYGSPDKMQFAAFDLMVGGKYLDYERFKLSCKVNEIATVPVLETIPFSLDEIARLSTGKTVVNMLADHYKEGVVVKPLKERTHPKVGRVVMKYISEEHLLSKHPEIADD